MSSFIIRDATRLDLPRIVEIYNASIPGRLATGDLELVSMESKMPWFSAHNPDTYPLIVAEGDKNLVAGWASLTVFFNGRAAYRHTAEISVYVAADQARRGIASKLTDELISRCPRLKIKSLAAFVFGHNDASVKFFLKKNFVLWGKLPKIAELDGVERDLDIYGLRL
jgi:L-amino acid N-acyltransferase YncA